MKPKIAEAAEAEAAKWRELHDDRDRDLAFEFARANAAETEVAQLRTALDLIDAARAKAVNEIETMAALAGHAVANGLSE